MTDEQYESLRRHILNLGVEVAELKLLVKQVIKRQVESPSFDASDFMDEIKAISIPDDLKKFFPDQN